MCDLFNELNWVNAKRSLELLKSVGKYFDVSGNIWDCFQRHVIARQGSTLKLAAFVVVLTQTAIKLVELTWDV